MDCDQNKFFAVKLVSYLFGAIWEIVRKFGKWVLTDVGFWFQIMQYFILYTLGHFYIAILIIDSPENSLKA